MLQNSNNRRYAHGVLFRTVSTTPLCNGSGPLQSKPIAPTHRRGCNREKMPKSERRITPRFNLRIPLSFHSKGEPAKEEQGHAINISTRGVFFVTNLDICVGEAIEILLEVPKRVTGSKAINRRFAGRVAHVAPVESNTALGQIGIGVQLLYYERDLIAPILSLPEFPVT